MPATATKSTAKSDASAIIDRLTGDAEALNQAAEDILWTLADDVPIDPRDANILRMAGFDDPHAIKLQRARVANVKRLMGEAGSNREYAAARKAVDSATAAENEQRPALEQQLADIQSKLQQLDLARVDAEQRLAGYNAARARLADRSTVPAFVAQRYDNAERLAKLGHNKRIAELESRLRLIDAIQEVDANSDTALLHAQAACPECIVRRRGKTIGIEEVDQTAWAGYQKRLRAERPEVQAEYDKVRGQMDDRLADAARGLNYYIDRIK